MPVSDALSAQVDRFEAVVAAIEAAAAKLRRPTPASSR